MAHIRPEKYIWLDGKLVPWNESHVHFLTHSLHYGLAAFEGIRAYAQQTPPGTGAIFRLSEHTDRLFDSCKLCLIDVPYTREQINQACIETMQSQRHAGSLSAATGLFGRRLDGPGRDGPTGPRRCRCLRLGPLPRDEGIAKGIRAKISSYGRNNMQVGLPKGKICGQYVNSVLAKREVKKPGTTKRSCSMAVARWRKRRAKTSLR